MWWRNSLVVLLAVTMVCMETKWAHLATESTTTMMALKPCDSGSSVIKSMEMVSHYLEVWGGVEVLYRGHSVGFLFVDRGHMCCSTYL